MSITKFTATDLFDDIFPSYFRNINSRQSLFDSFINQFSTSDDKNYYYEFLIPGVEKSDISIKVESGLLIVESQKKFEDGAKGRISKIFKNFKSTLRLPEKINKDEIKAEYNAGILTVTIPKEVPKSELKKIEVS